MKRFLCIVLVLFCAAFSACAPDTKIEFQTVLDEANALHEAQTEMTPQKNIRDFLPEFKQRELGFTEEELTSLTEDLDKSFRSGRYDERVFVEGRGFLPDLWVKGDALERVQKLIEYYGLAPQAETPAQSPAA